VSYRVRRRRVAAVISFHVSMITRFAPFRSLAPASSPPWLRPFADPVRRSSFFSVLSASAADLICPSSAAVSTPVICSPHLQQYLSPPASRFPFPFSLFPFPFSLFPFPFSLFPFPFSRFSFLVSRFSFLVSRFSFLVLSVYTQYLSTQYSFHPVFSTIVTFPQPPPLVRM